ncbi:MAG: DUF4395 family protein [Candidatus Nealsonbacteria bacterium]|nr:DUF4395 family protein [Candidatus Nealsonbacteria bacterium]
MDPHPCFAYNSSLRFTRNTFGALALLAFFAQSQWFVFLLGLAMALAAVSLKYNLPYQLHDRFLKKWLRVPAEEPVAKDSGELSFAWAMGASFLLIPSLLFYLNRWPSLAWGLVVLDSLLLLLAGIAGACIASILYASLIKKWLIKEKKATPPENPNP